MGRFDYSFLLKDVVGGRRKELVGEWVGYRFRRLLVYIFDWGRCVWEFGFWLVG